MQKMYSMDVSLADFDEKVIAASHKQPVVIDFWAPWCAPCKSLKPILEKLAEEYAGKFLLVKVNADENQELSAKYGVRGIPAVKAMAGGKIVDEFTGALPENEVRAWLENIIPSPSEELRMAAVEMLEKGNPAGALGLLAQAHGLDPRNEWVRVDSAQILLDQGEAAEAQRLLDSLRDPDVLKEDRVLKLRARLKFVQAGSMGDSEASLKEAIAANGDDLESRLKFANLLISESRHAEGMDQLIEIVRKNRGFQDEIARKTLLDVFNLLGSQNELVAEYRRKLSSALY